VIAPTFLVRPGAYTRTRQTRRRHWHMRLGLSLLGLTGLLVLLATGWHLPGIFPVSAQAASRLSHPVVPPSTVPAVSSGGSGAGGVPAVQVANPAAPADFCLPTDASCWMQSVAQWIAQQVQSTLQPVINSLLKNPIDILYQTPASDTYQNATVIQLWNVLMDGVDAALACLVVIGGYNAIVAPYLGLRRSSIAAFLPQLILAFAAAHFSLTFLGMFIDLENTLCLAVINAAGRDMLANAIMGLFQDMASGGLLLWLLVLVLAILVLCLAGQMIVRIGMVLVLIVLAGPALLCFGLPQTQRYGRLWMTMFTSTILVQFFQVTALALGGILLTSIGATNLLHLPQGIAQALMCMGVFFLVLKIPNMLNRWALHPMQEGSEQLTGGMSSGGGAEAVQGYVQDQAARQESIDALAALI
jgi:hypothetical protein